jgi:hypothetical protein
MPQPNRFVVAKGTFADSGRCTAALELKAEQVQELIDFWHAVEYLGKIADSKKMQGAKRKHWLTIQKRRLLNGEIGSVVIELETLLKGRKSKNQRTWLNYFRTHGLNHRRMDYAASRSQQLPIGSGAIKNAVRRVINLRLKGNGIFWRETNAELMLQLRALVMSDRWNDRMSEMRQLRKTTCLADWNWTPSHMSTKSEPQLKSTQNTA